MVHITKCLLKFNRKKREVQRGLKIWNSITPRAPPCQSTPTEKSDSKLASMYVISQTSGVHILTHREKKITKFGGGTIIVLGTFYLDCLLCKYVGCTGLYLLCNNCGLGNFLCHCGNLKLQLGHPINKFHGNQIQAINITSSNTTLPLLLQVSITKSC
jgi:hypothetical protein